MVCLCAMKVGTFISNIIFNLMKPACLDGLELLQHHVSPLVSSVRLSIGAHVPWQMDQNISVAILLFYSTKLMIISR